MNRTDSKYGAFSLVKDMLDTAEIVRRFDPAVVDVVAGEIAKVGRLHLTGEGSSRIFPAKHAITQSHRRGDGIALHTEGGVQSMGYDLSHWAVFGLSNSGKTREVIELFDKLKNAGHQHLYSLTAFADSKLESLAHKGFVLTCGKEGAVAATKSVVEQALFYEALLQAVAGKKTLAGHLRALGDAMEAAMTTAIAPEITTKIAEAGTIYFAGENDGVAEELTLKTNEITRRKSDYLEGTYAVHGVEEVMDASDVVIWLNPSEDQEEKFETVLVKGVGMTVIAVSDRATRFPTIRVPKAEPFGYVMMAAGWNLLVEAGIALGVNLDKPVRARKVGNEYGG